MISQGAGFSCTAGPRNHVPRFVELATQEPEWLRGRRGGSSEDGSLFRSADSIDVDPDYHPESPLTPLTPSFSCFSMVEVEDDDTPKSEVNFLALNGPCLPQRHKETRRIHRANRGLPQIQTAHRTRCIADSRQT